MTQSVQWPPIGGAPFNIPEDGETNWPDLTEYLVALAQSQGTKAQKVAVRKVTTTPSTISSGNDCFVSIELGSPAPATVNLPAGVTGQWFGIIDGLGDAGTNNITVVPAPGETIQGDTTYVMNANGSAAGFVFLAGDWKITWQAAGEGAGGGTARSSIDAATPNWVVINQANGKLGQEQYLSAVRGGLGANLSAFTGYLKMTTGSVSAVASIPGTDLSGGIAASKIGNGDVNNPTLSFLASVTSPVQTQLDSKLPSTTALQNLSTLLATNPSGFVAWNGSGTPLARSITAASTKVSVTNGNGVSGNPAIDVVESNIQVQSLGGTALPISKGGTGQTTATAAINALLPAQAGNAAKFLTTDGTNVSFAAAIGGYQTQVVTANPSPAQNNVHYLANTTGGAFTIQLPPGATGAKIKIQDDKGTWDSNNLTIQPIAGERIFPLAVSASLVCNVVRGWIEIVWDGAGWSPNSLASTTLGGGGGLVGIPATAAVTTAVNGVMYQADTTAGAFTITLPGGTAAAVIGVLDAGPYFTTNNLTIAPATGQFIDNGTVNQTLILDGNYQSVVLYRANGASVWEIQTTPAVQYTPGFQPGYTGGVAISSPNIGESYEVIIASASAAVTNTSYNVGSFVLQPGNWRLSPIGTFSRGSSAGNDYFIHDLSTTPGTLRSFPRYTQTVTSAAANPICPGYPLIIKNSAPQTVYFVGQYNFTTLGTSAIAGVVLVERTA